MISGIIQRITSPSKSALENADGTEATETDETVVADVPASSLDPATPSSSSSAKPEEEPAPSSSSSAAASSSSSSSSVPPATMRLSAAEQFAAIKKVNAELQKLSTNLMFKKCLERPMVKVALDIWGSTGVDHSDVDPDAIRSCTGVQQAYPLLSDLGAACTAVPMKLPVHLLLESKGELDDETIGACPALGADVADAWRTSRTALRKKLTGLRLVNHLLKQMADDYTIRSSRSKPTVRVALDIWSGAKLDQSDVDADAIKNCSGVQRIFPFVSELAPACTALGLGLPVAAILAGDYELDGATVAAALGEETAGAWPGLKAALTDGASVYTGMSLSTWGPKLWREMHVRGLYPIPQDTEDFASRFVYRIPCDKCSSHYRQMVRDHPPPPVAAPAPTAAVAVDAAAANGAEAGSTAVPDAQFEWSVFIHNQVNDRLSRPKWTVDQARVTYTVV